MAVLENLLKNKNSELNLKKTKELGNNLIYSRSSVAHVPRNISLFDVIFTDTFREIPADRPIYIDANDSTNKITFSQLKNQALVVAASFKQKFGLKPKDVIGVCSPDDIQYPVLFFAALAAGCILVPMRNSALSTSKEIAHDIQTIKPKLVIMHPLEIKTNMDALKSVGIPDSHILTFANVKSTHFQTINDIIRSSNLQAKPYQYTEKDIVCSPCCLYFTSGSSGRRKAVIITQMTLIYLVLCPYNTPDASLSTLATTTFSFGSSLASNLIMSSYFGIPTYVLGNDRKTIQDIFVAVEKYRIGRLSLPPYLAYGFVKNPKIIQNYDLSSLRLLLVSGSTLDQEMVTLAAQNTGLKFVNTYGMTECPGMVSNTPKATLAGSIGWLDYGLVGRIVDSKGNNCPVGKLGELRVKGPTVTQGYYGNQKETDSLFDDQGYMRTGDICRVDENGLIFYVTRLKDLIKYRSIAIYPMDIEKIILTHPSVTDCAVVGIELKSEGFEVPRAYVSLVSSCENSNELLQEIKDYTDAQLPEMKRLRGGVYEIAEFPRTGSGKIQRFELRQWANKIN